MGRNVNEDVGKDMEVFFPNNNGVAHCFHFHNTSLPRHAKLRHWLAHRGVGLVTSNIAQNCPFGRRLTQSFSGFEVSTYSRARLSFLPRETTHGPEHKYFGHGNRIIIRWNRLVILRLPSRSFSSLSRFPLPSPKPPCIHISFARLRPALAGFASLSNAFAPSLCRLQIALPVYSLRLL